MCSNIYLAAVYRLYEAALSYLRVTVAATASDEFSEFPYRVKESGLVQYARNITRSTSQDE